MQTQAVPRISIISPILNVERYIAQTIESILQQSFQDWELLVMDGASTDGTLNIVRGYAQKDPRILVHSDPDEGVAHAADKGFRLARGEFVTLMCGQDGFLDHHWLKRCTEVFDGDPAVSLVWALSKMMSDDGIILENYYDTGFDHLIRPQTKKETLKLLVKKALTLMRDMIVGPLARKKIILQKIFSRNAALRAQLLLRRSFPGQHAPQKEEWFWYWLQTGIPFSDQSMVVDRNVFLRCLPEYQPGSRSAGHMADFYFNFNSRGSLAYFLPEYPVFVRWHPGQSGAWAQEEIQRKFEEYLGKVRKFRNSLYTREQKMIFVDRKGKAIVNAATLLHETAP